MISSRQNSVVRFVKSLNDKKGRKISGCYLVEGEKMVREAFLAGKKVKMILGEQAKVAPYLDKSEVIEVTREIAEYCSDSVTPQGILAVVEKGDACFDGGNAVLLDGVADPGNVGTIIRTCAAAGVNNVIAVNCADPYSPKCVRSSMSGIFYVNIAELTYAEAIEAAGDRQIIVADMSGENVFGVEADGFCLVIGSEAHGVSEFFKNYAAKTVAIPMKDNMESLNAGVSCSIILYQFTKNKF